MDGSTMMDAKEYLKKMSAELDGPIKSYIGDEEPKVLMDASKQYPYAGGKRMRPAMAVACCRAVGGDASKALPLEISTAPPLCFFPIGHPASHGCGSDTTCTGI